MPEKILIVDDDLETLRLVGIMLQRQGYQIVAANSGAQAIKEAIDQQPDIVLLDVMMPEMDGYEVARKLRGNPETATIPILMFTAKGQVEDKITGYESGADDYLTKPTHPAELNAHIKALLARAVKVRPTTPVLERGYTVAVVAAKGGVGASTVALNLAVFATQKSKLDALAVEFRPGAGTWGLELGYVNPEGLRTLMQYKPPEITPALIEKELIANATGIRLLMSTYQPKDLTWMTSTMHFEAILGACAMLAPLTVVDIGTSAIPDMDRIFELVNEVIVVVDPNPISVSKTKALLDDLAVKGFGKGKQLTAVMVNRIRSDVQLSWSQVQEELCVPVNVVFTPTPELAYQAALRFTPIGLVQADSLINQHFTKLAEIIAQHAKKS